MAALNFPTSPSVDDVYTANGTTWKWNGTSWDSVSSVTGALKSIQSTVPGTLTTFVGTIRYYPQSNIVLNNVFISMGTAPTGTAAVFNIRKNGVAIFSGSKPTVGVGSNSSASNPISVALNTTDYLTVDVETASGADAFIRIDYSI